MIISIELVTFVYMIVFIPSTVLLSKLAWVFGNYINGMLDLRYRRERLKLEKELKE